MSTVSTARQTNNQDAPRKLGASNQERSFVNRFVNSEFDAMWKISKDIHSHPQVAFEETYASNLCRKTMSSNGFKISNCCKNLPTSFRASWSNGIGPHVAFFAEYDALPNLGHACGHNLIATTAMLGALATKAAMEQFEIKGTIEVYGTPAEEDGGGKIIMLNNGCFNELDAVYLMHPTSAKTRIGGICTSFTGAYVTYMGKSAHAESHPEDGINAMDAVALLHTALGVARQQLPDDVHICDVILNISDNIGRIPAEAKLEIEVSSTTGSHIVPAMNKVRNCIKGIALATGCEFEIEELGGYLGRIPNSVLGDIARTELEAFGEAVMDGMPSDKGGEDLGDVSRVIPACNIFGSIMPERKISGHTPEFRELAISKNGEHCLRVNSKAMATSALALFHHPEYLKAAKDELRERLLQEG